MFGSDPVRLANFATLSFPSLNYVAQTALIPILHSAVDYKQLALMDEDHYAGGRQITAPLNYLRWRELYKVEKPFQIFIDIPDDATDKRSTNLEWETHQVNIQDARGSECDFTLDDYGFVFRRYPSDFNCFTDRRLVEDKYFPEIEQILRSELKGLDKVRNISRTFHLAKLKAC